MRTFLKYRHTRNIFKKNNFNPSVNKWFRNPRYEGSLCGNWDAIISVDNYEDVKKDLPKSLMPIEIAKTLKELF